MAKCRFCEGEVSETATKCRHCGEWLTVEPSPAAVAYKGGEGSGGNVTAALASFILPGLGQLTQGRLGAAIGQFIVAVMLWPILLGWLIHIWSAVDAARFQKGMEGPEKSFKMTPWD